jgi:hypothetical protein
VPARGPPGPFSMWRGGATPRGGRYGGSSEGWPEAEPATPRRRGLAPRAVEQPLKLRHHRGLRATAGHRGTRATSVGLPSPLGYLNPIGKPGAGLSRQTPTGSWACVASDLVGEAGAGFAAASPYPLVPTRHWHQLGLVVAGSLRCARRHGGTAQDNCSSPAVTSSRLSPPAASSSSDKRRNRS